MKAIPFDSRRKNLGLSVERPRKSTRTALGLDRCPTCADTGFVIVSRRPAEPLHIRPGVAASGAHDELGPCPLCQAGYLVEFPAEANARGPWGVDGFWQGRDTADLETMCQRPLEATDEGHWTPALVAELSTALKDMPA